MRKMTTEQRTDQRDACLCVAERLLVTRGWGAINTRELGTAAGISKSLVSQLFPGDDLRTALVRKPFAMVEAVAILTGDPDRIHIGDYELRLRSLFENGAAAPKLMTRAAGIVGSMAGRDVILSIHFFEAQAALQQMLESRCQSGDRHVGKLLDWYVAASTVFCTRPDVTADDLPFIGQILGTRRS